ncbi:unnamed protein product [Mycena citricolor]|uniref:Integrase core domain-containing protein n=1 Tax=Mycena citricolor TaxID=2018698 RepID=A0AAD2HLP1_9AGAR|nr:unnamed protein product [Mycena citricolor]CAK5278271.1 unnamed protein product [Mycena citricolor]CAK5279654.1 unnamed protein product [Mycena citricolor]CAK5279664.1 unnamed protein product [Mycena citricolor]CAK5279705.1 unnamed protein product [Mycena citricolor]
MPNQYKPVPNAEDLRPFIEKYWKQNKKDVEIVELLKKYHIDLNKYGLEVQTFRKIREKLGFIRTRRQGHTVDTIGVFIVKLRPIYPKAGGREMVSLLLHEENVRVSRETVMRYFHTHEPDLVRERRRGHFKRKQFWAAGANDIWAVDQHDKWKYKFGLALHTGIDPFLGMIHWLKIWWNNSNPRLIFSYYLETVERLGVIPLVTQSDPGSENVGIANGHTQLRHYQDPSLIGTSQHRWMRKKKNIMPEITWSQMRRRFTPGFEDILDVGVNEGWYNPGVLLEALVFRWVFIPWLQGELELYRHRVNNTAKRCDRNKILPHGVPTSMFEFPEDYAILDFKIKVDPIGIEKVRQMYAPPDHDVFLLVPPDFEIAILDIYAKLNSPIVDRDSCWDVYLQLLNCLKELDQLNDIDQSADARWGHVLTQPVDENIPLLPNLQELRGGEGVVGEGAYYMGGVNNGDGLGMFHYLGTLLFTDSSPFGGPEHHACLNAMINDIEPEVDPMPNSQLPDDAHALYAWFSDEEDSQDFNDHW